MYDLIDRQAAHNMMVHLKRYAWTSPVSTEHHVTVDADDVNFGLDKLPAVDAIVAGSCDGCIYSNRKRPQKCSCCRRNRYLKDCYKEGV